MAKDSVTMTTAIGSRIRNYGELVRKSVDDEILALYNSKILPQFRAYVADWSDNSKPKFIVRKARITDKSRSFSLLATGTVTQRLRWKMIDKEGRKSGKRIVRVSGTDLRMHFQTQYQQRTLAGAPPQYALAGTENKYGRRQTGPWVSPKVVEQGAIKPREFTKYYFETRGAEEFRKAAARGYDHGHKKRGQRRKRGTSRA